MFSFEPVQELVDAVPSAASGPRCANGFVGSYETLPILRSVGGRTVSLQDHGPFAAGVCGWASVAHVRTDHGRVSALRAMAALVEGPMLLSVYAPTWAPSTKAGVRGGISKWLYGTGAMFLPGLGRVQTFGEAELRNLIERAGLDILALDTSPAIDNWPHAVVHTPQ